VKTEWRRVSRELGRRGLDMDDKNEHTYREKAVVENNGQKE
jgi:hypothetical protein